MTEKKKYALCSKCDEAYVIDASGMELCQVCGGELIFMSPCCMMQFERKNAVLCPKCGKRVRGFTEEQPDD